MNTGEMSVNQKKFCFLSSYPPRECGIATFTKDLAFAMDRRFNPKLKSKVIALNENIGLYNYSKKVIMQIDCKNIAEYINVAKEINENDEIKLICIQHEFGLFGGEEGSYLIPFLETVQKPVVVTFHSVVPGPDNIRRNVVRFIASKSAAIIVMAKKAIEILKNDYGIEEEKIHLVYHGIPNIQLRNTEEYKEKLRLQGKTVLATFGLLSRGKGVEYVIQSLPRLVDKYPNLLYIIIGETHPVVRREDGEKYRNKLISEVERLGLQNHVKFYNKFLTLNELIDYLSATDIYICTNLDEHQIVSGTLSYACGCGKAIISTPIVYAREILAENRGVLVNFEDPDSFTSAIDKILSKPEFKEALEKNVYSFSRSMIWSNVAARYLSIFNKVANLREEVVEKYPPIKLNHLQNLTDNFGCIQFSKLTIPDEDSGYTLDDNARALIAAVLHNELFDSEISLGLISTYMNFFERMQTESGFFQNFIDPKKKLLSSSEDAFGRAVWSLGYVVNKSKNKELKQKAEKMLLKAQNSFKNLGSLRAKAFCILGLYYYYQQTKNEEYLKEMIKLAQHLIEAYEHESFEAWQWFEPQLTYSNSRLPEALFLLYDVTKNAKYLEIAEKTLSFLSDLVFFNDYLVPIGQNGWYNRNGKRAFFDQQPVDACSMVHTYITAFKITSNPEYYKKAVLAFNWFLGRNHLNQMIYDENTGGCYDGLCRESVNLNQGAESTISYLLARLFLEEIKIESESEMKEVEAIAN
ncbi:MAG: glycosyltransferase [Nanoarchaeota archaeon]